jgi:hypothetical protein
LFDSVVTPLLDQRPADSKGSRFADVEAWSRNPSRPGDNAIRTGQGFAGPGIARFRLHH